MGFYNFKEGVYLVEGNVNGCIYDLNQETLYEINKDLKNGLVELIKNNVVFHESLHPVIEQLKEMQLLEINDFQRGLKDIKEIGDQQKQIDSVWINMTDRCNLSCIHCFQESSPDRSGEMELEDFKKIIDNLIEHGVKQVIMFGGEPLLLQDKLVEMLDYSRKHFQSYEIFTNATLINEYWIEVFKKYKPLIRLSLHSFIREEQDKVTTVPGSYDMVYKAIELLGKNDIPHVVTMTYMKGIEVGEKNIDCKIVTDVAKMAGRADINILTKDLLRKKLITQEKFTWPLNVEKIKKTIFKHECYGRKLYIDTNLDVYPCASDKEFKHGNLKNASLDDILQDEIIFLNNDKFNNCNQCEYRYACISCRSDRWNMTKMDQPWYCTYDPIAGEWQEVEAFIEKFNLS